MTDKYIVELKSDAQNPDDHQIGNSNLMKIEVLDKDGKCINDQIQYVVITLSKDGALGFGKNLIRRSISIQEFSPTHPVHHHIMPISDEYVAGDLGVFLAPQSPELVVAFSDLGSIGK